MLKGGTRTHVTLDRQIKEQVAKIRCIESSTKYVFGPLHLGHKTFEEISSNQERIPRAKLRKTLEKRRITRKFENFELQNYRSEDE